MRERLSDYQEKYGDLYNLEATPAESTSFRLAKHDKKLYPDIITASNSDDATPYYTNSSHLPVSYTADIFDALDIQDELQTLYTSGTVFHSFLGERLPSWQSAMKLVRSIAENYKLPYYTMSPTYSVCADHGYISGEVYQCPVCGKKTEVYSRITGYYRPVQNWNDGKTQEWKERKVYDPQNSVLKHTGVQTATTDKKAEFVVTKPMLFVQDKCPNCKMAEIILGKLGIEFDEVDATQNKSLVAKLQIKMTPTLVVADGDGYAIYENASNIRKWAESAK
jgi:ribonucleoside-triphosphate reductase